MASIVSQIPSLREVGALLENCHPETSEDLLDIVRPVLQNQNTLEDGVLCLQLGRLVEGPDVYRAQVEFFQEKTTNVSSIISFRYNEENSPLIENKRISWDRLDPEVLKRRTTLFERVSNTGIHVIFKVKKENPTSSLREVVALLENCYPKISEDLVATLIPVLQNKKTLGNGMLSLQLKMLVQDGHAYSAQVEYSQDNHLPVANGMVDWDRLNPEMLKRRMTLFERVSNTGIRVILTAKTEGPTLESCWNRIVKSYQKKQSAFPSYLDLLVKKRLLKEGKLSNRSIFILNKICQGDHVYRVRVVYVNQKRSRVDKVGAECVDQERSQQDQASKIAVSMTQYNRESSFLWQGREINWDRLNELDEEQTLLQISPLEPNNSMTLTLIGKRIQ